MGSAWEPGPRSQAAASGLAEKPAMKCPEAAGPAAVVRPSKNLFGGAIDFLYIRVYICIYRGAMLRPENKRGSNMDNTNKLTKKIKFKNIPMEFVLKNWEKAVEFCDNQTSCWCYCGRLASGFHTSSCRQFIKHVHNYIENLYNNKGGKA